MSLLPEYEYTSILCIHIVHNRIGLWGVLSHMIPLRLACYCYFKDDIYLGACIGFYFSWFMGFMLTCMGVAILQQG